MKSLTVFGVVAVGIGAGVIYASLEIVLLPTP
jgi:hypothetical protein